MDLSFEDKLYVFLEARSPAYFCAGNKEYVLVSNSWFVFAVPVKIIELENCSYKEVEAKFFSLWKYSVWS